ncbi:hypothetical protein FSP39_004508 [Pinctada imbricata]|uniref:EF-hand domain-containing protein n=1 Tax=Pinctada imbricata TaxID=66713 RepID=A0AA88XV00_PINIB|nr:hypothetical protein FSP39_004508 [Pinctada imbricata]
MVSLISLYYFYQIIISDIKLFVQSTKDDVKRKVKKKKKSRFVDANLDRFTGFSRPGQPYFVPPNMSERLSYEELEEAFCLFEAREEGVILVDKVKDIVKILGMDPDPERLEYLLTHAHKDENRLIKYKDYVGVILKLFHDDESEDALRKAFRVFDESESDTISVDSLRHVLTKMNDDDEFTEEEVQNIIKAAKPDSENLIHYEKPNRPHFHRPDHHQPVHHPQNHGGDNSGLVQTLDLHRPDQSHNQHLDNLQPGRPHRPHFRPQHRPQQNPDSNQNVQSTSSKTGFDSPSPSPANYFIGDEVNGPARSAGEVAEPCQGLESGHTAGYIHGPQRKRGKDVVVPVARSAGEVAEPCQGLESGHTAGYIHGPQRKRGKDVVVPVVAGTNSSVQVLRLSYWDVPLAHSSTSLSTGRPGFDSPSPSPANYFICMQ